jgi:branched-chain amino acid transport system permease protein
MDWKELAENFWEDVKGKIYYILGVVVLILVPSILTAPGFSQVPVLSDIYAFGRNEGLFDANTFVLKILSLCMIWAIFAAAWDFLSGYTGQISFGHAIFWGIASYSTFWVAAGFKVGLGIPFIDDLLRIIFGDRFVLDPPLALIFGGIVAAVIALIIGIIALRVKGPYLALVTLIIPLIFSGLVIIFKDLFGPSFGIPNIPSVIQSVGDRETDAVNFYVFTIIVFFITVGFMMLIAFSRVGLAFQSIREDEDAAESLGINVRNYKILAFIISAFFAGIAGGMYSQWLDFTGPSFFGTNFSFAVIIMVVIGGVGSVSGGVVGAFLLTILTRLFLEDVFQGVHALDILVYGLLLVLTLRYMRFGLARATKDQKKAIVIGILFGVSWTILIDTNIFSMLTSLSTDSLLTFITLIIMFILTIPAMPVFIVSEIIGIFVLNGILGMGLVGSSLTKAKFLIYASIGIPFAYYLPKMFKIVRLRYWGVWPSAGRYEPD